MKRLLYICSLIAVALTACKKDDFVENTPYTVVPNGDPAYSYIKFLNMTPGSPGVNFFVNDVKISGVNNTAGTVNGYGYAGLYPDVGYSIIKPGSNILKANIAGSASVDAGVNVFSDTFNMVAGKYFSIFTTGEYNAATKKIPSSLIVEDIKPALDTSKIFLRVVNLYVGGPSVDLIQASTGQKLISNVAFNTSSAFVEIPNPGLENTYDLKSSTANATLKAALLKLTLTKGRAYTFIIRGVNGSTIYPLSATSYTTFLL